MNFGSYRYFTSKSWGKFSFNKNTFKMMSSSSNRSANFATLFSNKLHLVGRVQTLNNIVKRGIAGTSGSITGNGVNIYNNPDISADLLSSNSLMSESLVGCGFNMTSNIFKMAVISDYLLICDGKNIFFKIYKFF
jgi:hypothetical protein